MTTEDLNRKLLDKPFRPFRIKLTTGSTVDVLEPHYLMLGETTGIVAVEMAKDVDGNPIVKRWRTISLDHIVQYDDLDVESSEPKRRRK